MLVEIIVFGGILFWLFVASALMWMTYYIDDLKGAQATTVLIGTLVLLVLFGDSSLIEWIKNNPSQLLLYFGVYYVVGVVWLPIKWKLHIKSLRRKFDDLIASGKSKKEASDAMYYDNNFKSLPPKIKDYRGTAIMWMSYWPISLIWTIINDPVKRMFEAAYHSMATTLQKMADKEFDDIDETSM